MLLCDIDDADNYALSYNSNNYLVLCPANFNGVSP